LFEDFSISKSLIPQFCAFLKKRPERFEKDLLKIYRLCERAQRPEDVILAKIKEAEAGGIREERRDQRANNAGEEKPRRRRNSKWDEPTEPPMKVMNPGIMATVLKPELCADFTKGHCKMGDDCQFAHNLRELAPGGIKHRLCPEWNAKGGCPRKNLCLYAHTKDELAPGFKCQLCWKQESGTCRSALMCKLAHGEQELAFFQEFMKGDTRSQHSTSTSATPMLAGLANNFNMGSLSPPGAASAKPPAYTPKVPKLNLAKLPASMKAGGFVQTGTVAKGAMPTPMLTGPPGLASVMQSPGMGATPAFGKQSTMQNPPGLFGDSFAKRPAIPSQPGEMFNATAAMGKGDMASMMASMMAAMGKGNW